MLGVPFTVVPSGASEALPDPVSPTDHVIEISRRKAHAVAPRYRQELVLGADTVVVLDDDIIEKPVDAEDAARMLGRLSGETHRVFTGLTLIDTGSGRCLSDVAVTEVSLRPLSDEDIRRYVQTGEPLDKAGAYAAQGRATVFIESVKGCFYNVVGLPLACFWDLVGRVLGRSPWTLVSDHAPVPDLISSDGAGVRSARGPEDA
jgi:septum formation protein